MNGHLDDGQLRAALDGELDAISLRHLDSCEACLTRQRTLAVRTAEIGQHLAFLSGPHPEGAPAAASSLEHFYAQKLPQKETFMFKKVFASTTVRLATAAILLFVIVLSVPSARALADEILNLFRVQQVTVIPIDATGIEQLTGSGATGKQISELISSAITVTQQPGDPVQAADAADASQKASFAVRLPQNVSPSSLNVRGGFAFKFTADRTKAQALLEEAGRSDLVLPQSIDGAVISVTIPASVQADYGSCPDPKEEDSVHLTSRSRENPDCVILAEMPSPTVNAPADLDVAQLAQIGLEFTGMTSDEAAAFTQSVDWTSTLVIPIPINAATYEQVPVDGVTGTLIQRPSDDAPQFVLIWIKDGIVYAIGGLGTDSQQALDMANSMP